MEIVELRRPILTRASHPLPTELGFLDAIFLASAMAWRERADVDLVMATHDLALATASRACAFRVVGTE